MRKIWAYIVILFTYGIPKAAPCGIITAIAAALGLFCLRLASAPTAWWRVYGLAAVIVVCADILHRGAEYTTTFMDMYWCDMCKTFHFPTEED